MKKIPAIFRILLCAAFCLLAIGCTRGAQESTGTTDSNAPLQFSWYIDYDWFTPPNSWGADPVSAWLKENKKVDITWTSPGGASGDRLNLLVATGDMPDVICLADGPRVTKLIEAGLILNLDPYLDDLPNLKKWAGLNLELLRYKDGNLYQFPNWYINPEAKSGNGSNGWGINTKIYAALGSPKIETFDDLESYLTRVKAAYPDVIPLETCDGFQAGQLVYRGMGEDLRNNMDNRLGTPRDGRYSKVFEDPYVLDTITFFNRLMRKRLITQDAFTQTRDQVIEKLINGQVAIFTSFDFSNLVENVNGNNKIDKNLYDVLLPVVRKGVNLEKVTLSGYATIGWNVNVFSKSAEPKIRQILKYLDWATGEEGQRILCYGPPGLFWDKVDENGIPFWNETYEKASEKVRTDSRIFNWNWVGNTSWVDIGKVAANKRLPPDRQSSVVRMQGIVWKYSINENQYAYPPPDPATDIGIVDTQIHDIYDEAQAKAILASSEQKARQILRAAQEEMDSIGYDQYLEYHNTAWAKQRALIESLKSKVAAQNAKKL